MTDSEIVAAEIRAAEVPMSDALGAALDRLQRDAEKWRNVGADPQGRNARAGFAGAWWGFGA